MITALKKAWKLVEVQGWGWLVFRISYWIRLKSGIIRWQVPAYSWQKFSLKDRLQPGFPTDDQAYASWRKQNLPTFFFKRLPDYGSGNRFAIEDILSSAQAVLDGNLCYFSQLKLNTGFPPDWLTDPITGTHYKNNLHWSRISDYGSSDIKFLWEANRFSYIFQLIRAYAIQPDERYAQAFWLTISSWMEANPPGYGPNWKDGQEVALRLMAACFGYYAFLFSSSTKVEDITRFTLFAAAHAERIRQNLEFAQATHSNHTISEGFGLWLVGTLFPELRQASNYERTGRSVLEQEARFQFFADGSYAMYSLNYQRFAMHLYLLAIRLGDIHSQPFSDRLKSIFGQAVAFLAALIEPSSGGMPRFGSDDGAMLLPLNECDYNDYRPLVQAGHYLLTGDRLFSPGPWDEDLLWFFGVGALSAPLAAEPIQVKDEFPQGGVFIHRQENSQAFIRCVQYQSRPSHADQLHVDLWWHGKNLLIDAGSYLYNGGLLWNNALAHTSVHNTVTVDYLDQMVQVSRITWVDWAEGEKLPETQQAGLPIYRYRQDGYTRLDDPVSHERSLVPLPGDRWLIIDQLSGAKKHHYRLHWLLPALVYSPVNGLAGIGFTVEDQDLLLLRGSNQISDKSSVVLAEPESNRGWRSRYYAQKEAALSLALECDSLRATFWSFLGQADDLVVDTKDSIKISTDTFQLRMELDPLKIEFNAAENAL